MNLTRPILAAALIAACSAPGGALQSSAGEAISASKSVTPSEIAQDVVYLTTPQRALRLDLYIHPDAHNSPAPMLIYFHGGGWNHGAPPTTWTGFRGYLNAGFSVATVEYRFSGEAQAPAAVQDGRCALKWIVSNASSLGVDTDRLVIMGTSAGGHLALMMGLLPEENDIDVETCQGIPRPAAVLDFYGPTELASIRGRSGGPHPSVDAFTGTGEAGDNMKALMSPVNYLTPDTPPIFIVHGDADPLVPVQQSYDLQARLDELGVPNQMHIVKGGLHGKFPQKEDDIIQDEVIAFLQEQGILD